MNGAASKACWHVEVMLACWTGIHADSARGGVGAPADGAGAAGAERAVRAPGEGHRTGGAAGGQPDHPRPHRRGQPPTSCFTIFIVFVIVFVIVWYHICNTATLNRLW